jgi:hypothetical protein
MGRRYVELSGGYDNEHVMGSSAQQFTDAVVVCERIEQGVKSGRISAPTEKRGFERKEVHHVEDG